LDSPPLGTSGLAFGNGVFVMLDNTGRIRSSPDGGNWALGEILTGVQRLSFAHDRFFATGMGNDLAGRLLTSVDGLTWQETAPLPAGLFISGVVRVDDQWLAFGEALFDQLGGVNGVLLESSDLVVWTPVVVPTSNVIYTALAFPGGVLMAGGGGAVLVSPDGTPTPVSPLLPLPVITFTPDPVNPLDRLTLSGRRGQIVQVQAAYDLPLWHTIGVITMEADTETVEIIPPIGQDRQFYRLNAP
ncbi:MAG TPA: hypothetical protein PKE47_03890, partial [Verrucomicrobiota bacterium]|nr:hypothetical protein [Verrucomicrobiota bacterium]